MNKSLFNSKFNNLDFVLYVIFLIFLFLWFFADGVIFRSDSMVYLKESNDLIVNGDWHYRRFPYRGPVFTIVTSFSLWVSGNNPIVVGLIPRFAGLFTLILSFLLIRRHFGISVAFFIVFLIGTNPLFVEMSHTYHIDLFLTVFILCFINLFSIAIVQNNYKYMFYAGLFYSIAFLTKEMSMLLFFLVPMVILPTKMQFKTKFISSFYFTASLILVSWITFILSLGYPIRVILGRHLDPVANIGGKFQIYSEQLQTNFTKLFSIFIEGTTIGIYWLFNSQGLLVSLLILISIFYLAIKSLTKRNPVELLLFLAPVSFLPFFIYWGSTVISSRQLTSFVILLIISCAPVIKLILIQLKYFLKKKLKS